MHEVRAGVGLRPARWIALLVAGGLAATLLGACGCDNGARLVANTSSTTSPVPSTTTTPTSTPSTPVTGPAGVTLPTGFANFPTPYAPPYDTVEELASVSAAIVIGTLSGSPAPPVTDGSTTYYPINVKQNLGDYPLPRTGMDVSSTEVSAASLNLSSSYVFFWSVDTVNKKSCIVGGVRGAMAYDPSTGIVTRIDNNPTSQIPHSQSLDKLKASIQSALAFTRTQPITNGPPLCASTATGLSQ